MKLASALLGLGIAIAWMVIDRERAALAWATAFAFGLSTTVGAVVLICIMRLAHAKWWMDGRGSLFAVAEQLPMVLLLWVPLLLLRHEPGFVARSIGYSTALAMCGFMIRRRSLAAPTLILVSFGFTFAALDWFMALEPHHTSNIYGLWLFASGFVAATSIFALGARTAPEATRERIGRLLFATVFIWGYLGFFQLLIIWMADLPREVGFYRARIEGGWLWIAIVLAVGRFAIPYLLLLSRRTKTSLVIPAWLLATTALDFAWIVLPTRGAQLSPLDLAPFVGISGLAWLFASRIPVRAEATS